MSFEEVRPGMRGTGKTVFEGERIDSFDVEILGKLQNFGPDQNLILARLSGGPLARTGVLAGMSGSPVTIDGRLVGAVAYSWGFATEPIAGITPIGEMLELADADGAAPQQASVAPFDPARIEWHQSAEERVAFFGSLIEQAHAGRAPAASIPLSVSGVGPLGLSQITPLLGQGGFIPLQAGGPGAAPRQPPPFQPGSAMGLKLVRGDVDMTATGTVTWVDGDRVLGFGHPMFGLGPVDLPLTGATVQALLPSLQHSVRIATPLAEVGALRQDRAAGVLGNLGATPAMIPVRLRLSGADGRESSFAFDIAEDPLLSPLLLYASLTGVLSTKERAFGSATVRILEGSTIKLVGQDDVALDNLFAGPTAFSQGTGMAAYILYLLLNNPWEQPRIAGINLLLEYSDSPQTARVRRASLDRYRVVAGDSVQVTLVLSPYRGPDQLLTRELIIPPETPAGRIGVTISGSRALMLEQEQEEPIVPMDLDQLIRLVNRLRRNDQVTILATAEDHGFLLGGARLPNLPPSVAGILSRPRSEGQLSTIRERAILEQVVPTAWAVDGAVTLELEVGGR